MDNLIVSFNYHTRSIIDAGKDYAAMAQMKHSSGIVVDFPRLSKFLKWFPDRCPKMTNDELNEKSYKILPKE